MFDDEDHRRALKDFIIYLRTFKTQERIVFLSDISREHIRNIGRGESIPTVKVFFSLIEAAGLTPAEGVQKYLELLQQNHDAIAAEKALARNYIKKIQQEDNPR